MKDILRKIEKPIFGNDQDVCIRYVKMGIIESAIEVAHKV